MRPGNVDWPRRIPRTSIARHPEDSGPAARGHIACATAIIRSWGPLPMLRRLTPLLALLLVDHRRHPGRTPHRSSANGGPPSAAAARTGSSSLDAWTNGTGTLHGERQGTQGEIDATGSCCARARAAIRRRVLGQARLVHDGWVGRGIDVTKTITSSQMAWVWWARTGKITARFISGSSRQVRDVLVPPRDPRP